MGLSSGSLAASIVLPIGCIVLIVGSLVLAPPSERPLIGLATMVAFAAGLSSTAIGVYGGVLVPGLLLLGVDPIFAAALSLFLQVIVIPIGASTHYKLGNFSRRVALPLVLGGMIGSFVGPFVAAWVISGGALDKQGLSRFVAATIVGVGVLVLATLRLSGLGSVRAETDVPRARVVGIGLVAGLASGVSGAGWGPIGVKLLILSRIDPRQAIGSSLFARVFMAMSAVVAYFISATAFRTLEPDWWLVVPILAGSVAPMIPGAYLVSRLGRERATVGITLLSIVLAIPTLILGH
jgi:uncharacterized membrane protein YfcA